MSKRGKITERDCWIVESHNTNDESTEVTEQRLAAQVRQIKHKKWLETLEKEKITLRANNKHQQIETTEPRTTNSPHHARKDNS